MSSAVEFEKRVWEIIGTIGKGKDISISFETLPEAKHQKAKVMQVQKQLRLVKRDVTATKKAITSAYVSKKAQVGKGFGAGLSAGLFGKRNAGKMNALNRDSLQREQRRAIAPYEDVSRLIDNILLKLDDVKLQIDSWVIQNS